MELPHDIENIEWFYSKRVRASILDIWYPIFFISHDKFCNAACLIRLYHTLIKACWVEKWDPLGLESLRLQERQQCEDSIEGSLSVISNSTLPTLRTIDDLQTIKAPQFLSMILESCSCFGSTLHILCLCSSNQVKTKPSNLNEQMQVKD